MDPLFWKILEDLPDALVVIDERGLILLVNAQTEKFFGYTREELLGMSIENLLPQRCREAHAKHRLNYVSHPRTRAMGTTHSLYGRRKDGGEFPVDVSLSLLQTGDQVLVASTIRDITDRKLMEDALRRSENNFRSLVENSPYGILRTTPDGRILQANPAIVKMLGYGSENEVLNLNMASDVYRDPAERVRVIKEFENQIDQKDIEVEWKRKDGTPLMIRYARHRVMGDGASVDYTELIIEDITEQRSLEHQFRQAQKMESVGRLAGGVAHDFNNLLNVIIGYNDLLLEQFGENESLRKYLEEIKKAGDRAASLTRQLLAFSRQQVMELKVLDLNTIVTDIATMLQRLIGENIELHSLLDPALGHVKADQGQIEQIIMNLAVNARDAMPRGGKLVIETSNVELNNEYAISHPPVVPGRYVKLAMTDTGIGMDAQTQARIFEPFFTTKEQGKGTGLGLATVYGAVKQTGGYIWVYSEPGQGSTFRIYLPRVDKAIQQSRLSDVLAGIPRASETILLVEDEDALRTLVRKFLEENGYTVLEANSGSQALKIARQYRGPIHLLLTDVVMPGMNGHDVAKNVVPTHPEMSVVYMSGYAGFMQNGTLDVKATLIQKPFTREILFRKLREVLERRMESNPS